MRDLRDVIGKLAGTIKTGSRKGYQVVANTASQLKNKSGKLVGKIGRISTLGKNR